LKIVLMIQNTLGFCMVYRMLGPQTPEPSREEIHQTLGQNVL